MLSYCQKANDPSQVKPTHYTAKADINGNCRSRSISAQNGGETMVGKELGMQEWIQQRYGSNPNALENVKLVNSLMFQKKNDYLQLWIKRHDEEKVCEQDQKFWQYSLSAQFRGICRERLLKILIPTQQNQNQRRKKNLNRNMFRSSQKKI